MYYCKNCGEAYTTDEAIMCVKCGVSKGQGNSYCHNCGNPVNPDASVCLTCGVATTTKIAAPGAKSKIVAGLLGIFLGCFGIHNFYLGYTKKAIIQLCATLAGMVFSCIGIGVLVVLGISIWALVEGIMILTGKMDVDADGNALTD